MKKMKWPLAVMLLLCCQLQAQTSAPKKADMQNFPITKMANMPSNFYLTKLDNGLEVLAIEDHNVPLVTVEIVVRNGAFVQSPDLEGLAHLYEHMFFKANKDYPSQEAFLDRVNELGISFNGTTSNERVNYFVTLNKNKMLEGMQFMNSAIRYPTFLKEEMVKENVVVAGEFQRNESNPVFYLIQDMDKHLWGDLFPRKNSIGRYEVILNATPDIMQSIKDRYYYPNNSMLVVAGDMDHQKVFELAQQVYGDWKPSSFNIWEKFPVPDFQPLKYSSSFVTSSEISKVPFMMFSWHGPDTRNDVKATYAADVLSYILSQKNSKLQKSLIDGGLAYNLNGGYSTEKYVGPINILMVPDPNKIHEATDELLKQIDMWDSPDYYTDEQMKTAKEMLEVQTLYDREKTSEYVHLITYWWASASIDYFNTYVDNINKVTRQDINDYIHKYIKNKPYVSGMLISPTQATDAGLDKYFRNIEKIENYKIKTEKGHLDGTADKTLKDIAYLIKINQGRKIKIAVAASSAKDSDASVNAISAKLKELGVMDGSYELIKNTQKGQGEVSFSF